MVSALRVTIAFASCAGLSVDFGKPAGTWGFAFRPGGNTLLLAKLGIATRLSSKAAPSRPTGESERAEGRH